MLLLHGTSIYKRIGVDMLPSNLITIKSIRFDLSSNLIIEITINYNEIKSPNIL
jgi:hypothetical protein